MALEVLLATLEQEAREEAEAITAHAEAEASRILGRADADVKRRRVLHVERLEADGRAVLGRDLAAAVHAHRTRFLTARAEGLARVFTRAAELLRALPAERYRERLPTLAAATLQYLDETTAVVTCRPELVDIVRSAASAWPAATITGDPDALPGLLGRTANGSVLVDNTLPALLERQRDDLAIEVAAQDLGGVAMLWDDVNARARGIATHLLDRDALLRLSESRSWDAFVRDVLEMGVPLPAGEGGTTSPPDFDRAVGRVVAQRLALLARWLGTRRGVLNVIYEDEERRTLRALLRGAAQGGSPGARLRAITPTPGLPGRGLERLARAESPAALADELVRVGHPAGRALRDAILTAPALGLLGLETALTRLFATRATRAARRAGPVIRQFVAELIDLENAWTLILGGGRHHSITGDTLFVEGGAVLDRKTFLRLQATAELGDLFAQLRAAFAGRGLDRVFAGEAPDPARIEARALAARMATQRALARRNPLGPAVILSILERIRGEGRDLRTVAWGLALGAPGPAIEAQLVTAA